VPQFSQNYLNWLFSSLLCASFLGTAIPARTQVLLPYSPELDSEQLSLDALQLTQDAIQLSRFQQYDLAIPRAKLATQLAPDRYETWYVLGSLLLQQQEVDSAIKSLQKAQSLSPKDADILFSKGNIRQQ
jgi:cytochrome c-type biogenesis protein CcmH/NrfG